MYCEEKKTIAALLFSIWLDDALSAERWVNIYVHWKCKVETSVRKNGGDAISKQKHEQMMLIVGEQPFIKNYAFILEDTYIMWVGIFYKTSR